MLLEYLTPHFVRQDKSLASNRSRMDNPVKRSDLIRSLRDFVFSIFRFCCSNNSSRTLFSADPLEKKYDPNAILKIRKEIIIEAGRGFFKRNNNDKVAISNINFPNKQIDDML